MGKIDSYYIVWYNFYVVLYSKTFKLRKFCDFGHGWNLSTFSCSKSLSFIFLEKEN